MRLFGLFTLFLRPAFWLLLGAAFLAGMFYERAYQQSSCDSVGGEWSRERGCQGAGG